MERAVCMLSGGSGSSSGSGSGSGSGSSSGSSSGSGSGNIPITLLNTQYRMNSEICKWSSAPCTADCFRQITQWHHYRCNSFT